MSKTILTEIRGWTPCIDALTAEYGIVRSAVFGRVWRYCQGSDGVCKASLQRIADDLRLDKKTVISHLKALVDDGYIKDHTPDVTHKPHIYSDTGKARIKAMVFAGIEDEEGVENTPTHDAKGVEEIHPLSSQGVELLHPRSGTNPPQEWNNSTGGVEIFHLKKVLKIETKKEKEINKFWSLFLQSLERETPGMFLEKVRAVKPLGMRDGAIYMAVISEGEKELIEARFGKVARRFLNGFEGLAGKEIIFVAINEVNHEQRGDDDQEVLQEQQEKEHA